MANRKPLRPHGKISPGRGGCWFCFHDDGELLFDTEWDTFLHRACLVDALLDPDDFEADLMRYLLESANDHQTHSAHGVRR